MCNKAMVTIVVAAAVIATSSPAAAQYGGGRGVPSVGACFYKDADFRGAYFCAEGGEDLETLPSGANDEVSSIRIFGRAEVTAFKSARFRGDSRQFATDIRNLQNEGFNDEISSLQVQGRSFSGGGFGGQGGQGGRRSAAQRDPERVVRRAYQDVLGREPDASGMRLYRSRIIDEGWSEQQVRDDLRRSSEHREQNTMTRAKATEIVRRAYLAVLEREPDAGSSGLVDQAFRSNWTQQDVERELRKSDEYRNRNRQP